MKFHINKKGVPASCTATVNKCPYGGAGAHYNEEDASLVCKVQNELNHGLINSSRQNVKKAETEEEFKYIEIRRNALIENAKEMNEVSYIERIRFAVQLDSFNPKTIETYHFKVERETRNNVIKEMGLGEVIGDFKCKTKVNSLESEQIYRIYDSGYVEVYRLNGKDKRKKTHKLVTAYIFKRNQLEAIFLSSGNVVNSEWLSEVSENNKKMKKGVQNKIKEKENKKEVPDESPVKPSEKTTNTSEKNKVELSPEEQEKKRKKNAERRRRQRENARKRKSELFSKEQVENERSNKNI